MHINSFDIEIAKEYGVDEAIVIHKFQQWIKANKQAGRHRINGKTWLKQSEGEISKSFPYWDFQYVHRLITKLKKRGVIEMHPHGLGFFDYTPYFSFLDEERFVINFSIYGKEVIEFREEPKELPVQMTFERGVKLVEEEPDPSIVAEVEYWKDKMDFDCFRVLKALYGKSVKITSHSFLMYKTHLSYWEVETCLNYLENKDILKIKKGQKPIHYELDLSKGD